MTWLIIGSTATYHWFKDARRPKDLDILSPAKIVGNIGKVCVVDAQWHDAAEAIIAANFDQVFADPNVLLTLKVSHAHWNIHHEKTLFDIKFLQDRGAVVIEDLYRKLIPVWTSIHGKKTGAVNKPVTEFFTDAVPRFYDHEWLHKQVAFYESPLHERIRPDLTSVRCSHDMFLALSKDDQYLCALEEILVTAIERGNLTKNSKKTDVLFAVKLAHHKLCTTMASGWFARFIIENSFDLLITWRTLWLPHLNSVLLNLPLSTRLNSSTLLSPQSVPLSAVTMK